MEALVIDGKDLSEPQFSIIGAERIGVESETDRAVLTTTTEYDESDDEPEAHYLDPDDYPDTTAYLNAIPGMAESLIELMNAPKSEFEDFPRNRKKHNAV